MELEINNIITKIENQERLKDKEIENILNNVKYVVVYNFTNSLGHLTNYGKNEMVKQYKTEILEELYGYLNG